MFNLVSLDGYFARSNGEIDWHVVDDEFNKFAIEQTKSFGAILFGRTTYQLFEDHWPKAFTDPATSEDDREIAKIINDIEKIVFSRTLQSVTWNNTKLFKEVIPQEIEKLKNQEGSDIVIFGSGTIVQALTNLRLIDEYRIMINPVILGEGKPLFKNIDKQLKLKLLETKTFQSGNVLLYYQPGKTV